jgi:hypothetical protein
MSSAGGRRISPGLVVGVIALVLALGGSAAATSWRHLDLLADSYTTVGAPGAPKFGDGGQGDCVWSSPGEGSVQISGLNPPSFYRDPVGTVHLSGVAAEANGPGGDAVCGGEDGLEDAVIFVLPARHRPENVEIVGGAQLEALVIPDEGATVAGVGMPPGAVVAVDGIGLTVLDGAEFRAAGPGTAPIESDPAELPGPIGLRRALR